MKTLIYLALVASAAGDSASCPGGATLFFSQFQEASSGNNKYWQIYNPTSASISLAGYSIGYCVNGCSVANTFEYGQAFASGASIAAAISKCTAP